MNIVLATGIYPPDIGGPATYVHELAKELHAEGHRVRVLSYGSGSSRDGRIIRISKAGGPLLRWIRYARALRTYACDADVVYAFSSVSVGVPLVMARLSHPKKILRLGGDFGWERYTDRGGMQSLSGWYESRPRSKWLMQRLLNQFHHIVFSTEFQREIYIEHYDTLPSHSVIENAIPHALCVSHSVHQPLRILFMGRFVAFKNIPVLLEAVSKMSNVRLTLVGDGPERQRIDRTIVSLGLQQAVVLSAPVGGEQKEKIFESHDVLVIPSMTEISPNVALEARAHGLPVLLTEKTGLSESLADGMLLAPLHTVDECMSALEDVRLNYHQYAHDAHSAQNKRTWHDVYVDHEQLFHSLCN